MFHVDRRICSRMLAIAGPLTLSTTGSLVMQMADMLFLARYSSDALAAVGPAGVACWVYGALFYGVVGYAAPLVAQCVGKGDRRRVGSVLWQGVYLALLTGFALWACSFLIARVFDLMAHAEPIRAMEHQYFRILCVGMVPGLIGSVLSGFFAGRGDTRPLMVVQLAGVALNAVLDYALIFGHWGLPCWGIAGAAWATVIAQTFNAVMLAMLLVRPYWRSEYGMTQARVVPATMGLYMRFGVPSGFRILTEAAAWMMFVVYVGRVDPAALASSNIAHRLNMLAFFPVLGLSEAVRTLVGQSQGRRDPDESVRIVWHGLLVTEIWMIVMAALYVAIPRTLYGFFAPGQDSPEAVTDFARVVAYGVVLLRYVAAYCLLDAFNIVLSMALQAAGDTRWSMWMSTVAHGVLVAALAAGDAWRRSIHVPWAIATLFVMLLALVWLRRFQRGRWRNIVVIA